MSVGASNFRSAEDIIHGMQVRDPFRWLEDRGLSETQRWIDAQRASCEAYFAGCPALPILRDRVRMLLDSETVDQPVATGKYRFYRRREQGREQASIYVRKTATGVERCLVEPSCWGPFASVGIHRVSDDGQMLAYEFRIGGGDAREIRSWTLNGDPVEEIDVPKEGTIQILPQLIATADTFFYTHESFQQPPRIYEYAAGTRTATAFNADAQSDEIRTCHVERVSFPSSDGTEIPLTLVALPGTSFHQIQPVIMTGYGGFGAPLTPQYSVLVKIMLELGAIFVVPHIRGGGEFGNSWHEAARGATRQTAVEDFTRAAEWLCLEGITTPKRLAIFGGSNAGLLVAAAMTGKPGLFRAVLSIAPLLDMVRYERFDQAVKWRSEYGSVANAAEFRALLSYSPYHHVRRNIDYPAVLFVTGDSDDRCNPAHVRKMAARLQERAAQHHPVLVDYSVHQREHFVPTRIDIDVLPRPTPDKA